MKKIFSNPPIKRLLLRHRANSFHQYVYFVRTNYLMGVKQRLRERKQFPRTCYRYIRNTKVVKRVYCKWPKPLKFK